MTEVDEELAAYGISDEEILEDDKTEAAGEDLGGVVTNEIK